MNYLCCSTVPEYMPSPHVSPVSSSSLRVSWETPQDKDVRGEVTEYRVNLHQEQMSNPYAPPIVTQVSISAHSTFFFFIEKGHCQNILMCWHTALKLLWLYCLVLCFIHHTEHFLLLQFFKKNVFPYLIDMRCCIDKESCKLKWKKAFFVHSNLHFCPVLYFHSVCLVSRYACGVGWTVQKGLLYYSCESLCFFSSFG